MDEYSALAQRVVLTMDDVQGCLVLSRDGLVLGAYPDAEESTVKMAWLRFVHVGDARRSFVEFGDQTWAYVHRGPYAAFVVSGLAVRAGVLLDQLEQGLIVAEQARAKREATKIPEAPAAPTGRPRTNLHPPERAPVTETAAAEAWSEPAEMSASPSAAPPSAAPIELPPATAERPSTAAPTPQPLTQPAPEPSRPMTSFRRPEPVAGAEPPSTSPPPSGPPPIPSAERPHLPPQEVPAAGSAAIDLESLYAEFADLEADDPVDGPAAEASDEGAGGGDTPPVLSVPGEVPARAAEVLRPAAEAAPVPSVEEDASSPTGSADADAPAEVPRPTIAGAGRPTVPVDEAEEPTPEVDRVLLAKEFSGLLQLDADDDEARS